MSDRLTEQQIDDVLADLDRGEPVRFGHVRRLIAEVRAARAARRRPDVIAGVHRISHEAIDLFVECAEAWLDEHETARTDDAQAYLVDAVTNLRQARAEYDAALLTGDEREVLRSIREQIVAVTNLRQVRVECDAALLTEDERAALRAIRGRFVTVREGPTIAQSLAVLDKLIGDKQP